MIEPSRTTRWSIELAPKGMRKPQPSQPDELGALKWLLLLGVVLYGVFALVAWPFRSAARLIPGRREKLLREACDELRNAIPGATQLVRVLGEGDQDLDAKLDKKIRKLQKQLDLATAEKRWPEDLQTEDPWATAIDILERAKHIGGIDRKSNPEDLRHALAPLFRRRGVVFDWSLLLELERARDWEALKNENLLPHIGRRLLEMGYVLAHIDEGSDNYLFALCTPESFSQIESLSSGGYAVRRFAVPGP